MLRAAIASTLCAALLAAGAAQAHQTRLSSSRLVIDDSGVQATLELNGVDLNLAAGVALTGKAEEVLPQRLQAQREAVLEYLHRRVQLAVDGGPACTAGPATVRDRREHVVAELLFRCPPLGRPLAYRVTLFHEIDPAARHVVTAGGGERRFGLLGAANPAFALSGIEAGLGRVLWHYTVAGVEHIAIGYDHIAFLLAVIVLARRFWPLFVAITAFTVAHSLTLALAVTGVVTVPSPLVEAAIAASIVYVAAENFFVRDLRRRWRVTFAFGLIHGFGFASVLREYGIPENAVIPALAAFNVGVEIGQLLIVAAAVLAWRAGLAAAAALGARADEAIQRRLSLAVSVLVLLLGLYWLISRIAGP